MFDLNVKSNMLNEAHWKEFSEELCHKFYPGGSWKETEIQYRNSQPLIS